MIALGIDPGLANCGLVLVAVEGQLLRLRHAATLCSEPSPKKLRVLVGDDLTARTRQLTRDLAGLVHHADLVVCEAWSCPRSAGSAARTALARGALYALCEQAGRPLVQLTPQQVRRTLGVAKGAAKGAVVLEALERVEGGEVLERVQLSRREHAGDALAVLVAASMCSEIWRAAAGKESGHG